MVKLAWAECYGLMEKRGAKFAQLDCTRGRPQTMSAATEAFASVGIPGPCQGGLPLGGMLLLMP